MELPTILWVEENVLNKLFPISIDSDPQTPVPSGYDHVGDITGPLISLSQSGYARYRVFDDWTTLCLSALKGDDESYLEVADTYDREELDMFIDAFSELIAQMDTYQVDVIGDVYEAYGMQSDEFGQHFTPHPLTEVKTAMMMGGKTPTHSSDDSEQPHISDPTCGSGRLLVAAARQTGEDCWYFGMDKDPLCAKMSVINLSLFDLSGEIIHGDTLSLDVYNAWKIHSGKIMDMSPEEIDL